MTRFFSRSRVAAQGLPAGSAASRPGQPQVLPLVTRRRGRRAAQLGVALLGLAALGFAASSRAEGLYLGGSLAVPQWHGPVNGSDGDNQGVGVNLYGGYSFTPNWSLEAGYMNLGRLKGDVDGLSTSAKAQGGYLDAVGTLPIGERFSLLGRLGYAGANLKTTAGDDHGNGLKLGAGVQYDLSKQVALRGEWNRYRFDAFSDHQDVDQYSLGVKVGF
ncbi:porin family protein [Ideonella azotifigens]|uniref:Outer membrane protein beta-barrel domain-containing protein n=1 Tax=Ideonella azotifigens TaxID=513160 RepID=A0ABN1JM05_9BURK|nr:porin family protein [Ideonella azotifigens]MCD2339768.1 porin family protein [Ideonella azotifigens]